MSTENAEGTELAYCASCGKHWPAIEVEEGVCSTCADDLIEGGQW